MLLKREITLTEQLLFKTQLIYKERRQSIKNPITIDKLDQCITNKKKRKKISRFDTLLEQN